MFVIQVSRISEGHNDRSRRWNSRTSRLNCQLGAPELVPSNQSKNRVGRLSLRNCVSWGGCRDRLFPDGEAQSPPAAQAPVVNQGPGSAYSSGQRGGITAGTVNIGPGSRHLSPTQKEELISDLRGKKVKLDLIYSLDQETASFVTDFVDAFTMASVDFQKIIFGQTIPPQYGIFLYDPKGEAVELATALRNAKIPFMIAQSRAGTGPYPPQTPSLTIGLMPQNCNQL
jgi:hypothetical protein